jgi:hypothetical protein
MTTKRVKDFGSPKNEEAPPLEFKLYGEKFRCYPEVQGAKLMEFSEKVSSEDQAIVMRALLDFFKIVLLPEDYPKLQELWDDPDRIVPIETISEIVSWLVEEYTDRPTEASEDS